MRQPDTSPFVFVFTMQALKQQEYFVQVFGFHAYAIVPYINNPMIPLLPGFDLNDQRHLFLMVLQAVGYEVLKQTLKLNEIPCITGILLERKQHWFL